MAGREQPGNPVEGWAEVVAASLLGRPRVQGHPHAQGVDLLRPRLRGEIPLGGEGRLESVEGVGKARTESVAYSLEDVPTMPYDSFPEDLVVAGEGLLHDGRVAFPHLCGAFYVREQEGHGARGLACRRAAHWPARSS